MFSGLLQLSETTPGGDCLEISLDESNSDKLKTKSYPITICGTINRRAPLQQMGVQPEQPTYFRISAPGLLPQGFHVSRVLTAGPYDKGSFIEFEINPTH